jgi:opacity protein-like surface antigen
MKKLTILAIFALSAAAAQAADLKPFVMIDASSESDKLSNDYINANMTVGVKAPNKMEYTLKFGGSQKKKDGSESYSRNIEGKVKKSFDVGMPFSPYLSVRLGQKFDHSKGTSFTHWATDAGLKLPVTEAFAFDVGVRYRDAFDSSQKYQSTRYHVMGLYEIDAHNVVGLRYTTSSAKKDEEDRSGWRLHYQRNY